MIRNQLKRYPHDAFTEILAAYAAGHTVIWGNPGYQLTGSVDDPNVTFIANDNACGLFCDDGTSIYPPEEFTILPLDETEPE